MCIASTRSNGNDTKIGCDLGVLQFNWGFHEKRHKKFPKKGRELGRGNEMPKLRFILSGGPLKQG